VYFVSTSAITAIPPTPTPTPIQVAPGIIQLPLTTNDLVYDPTTRRVYASLPSTAGTFGNSLAPIDPVTGVMGTPVFVGSEPRKLAISKNNQYLYTGLDGVGAVRRFDLGSQTATLQFALGSSQFDGTMYVEDLAVSPDDPNAVAVSRRNVGFSPKHEGVAIYDSGVRRNTTTPGHTGSNVIEFSSSGSTLYGYNNESTEFGFRKMTVNASGVTTTTTTANIISGFGVDIKYDNGMVYASTGRVVNPESGTIAGTFSGVSSLAFVPDSTTQRVFFVTGSGSNTTLQAFDQNTFIPAGSLSIPGVIGDPGSLIRWGTNGLAFRTSGNQVFFVQTSVVPGNPIDDARNFIRQQYLDFLNREPDPGGWDFWTSEITRCGSDPLCIHRRRIDVSAAFFIELEFQETGYVVYRIHRAAMGTLPGAPTRANLTFARFMGDRGQIQPGAGLQQSTINFANAFVQRAEFLQAYPDTFSNAQFVHKLFDTAGLLPYAFERQQQIDAMNNNGKTRAQVLLDVIEISEFKTREFNPAFVLMQYFGYLRRNPDQGGYDFWLDVLNNRVPGNFRSMVCAFVTSAEYQRRFGTVVTRSNSDCAQ
jgi:hypothetical protein